MRAPVGPVVDEIMSRDVLRVDLTKPLAEARREMAAAGIHKIVVVKGDEPIGILEDWLAQRLQEKLKDLNEPDASIATALNRFEVETAPIRKVPSGTPIDNVKNDLASKAAVVVFNANRKIEGIVTVSDLDKLWERV